MKKLIAMLLCFAMVAAIGASAAFAAMPDPVSAENEIKLARSRLEWAKNGEKTIKDFEKVISYLQAYEAVKYNSSKTEDDVAKALDKAKSQLAAIGYNWIDPETVSSADVSTYKSTLQENVRWWKAYAEARNIWKDYYLSKGTKMDENALAIARAKHDAAYDLVTAQEAAATAKAGAVKAQATAKALIADAIKTAQDAAATAVANAQASAYSNLSDAYANAVESFWGEVELYVLGLG